MRRDYSACEILSLWVAGMAIGLLPQRALQAGELQSSLPTTESIIQPGVPLVVTVPAPSETCIRSVLISIKEPGRLAAGVTLTANVALADGNPAIGRMTKVLHLGDPDVLSIVRQPKGTEFQITLTPSKSPHGRSPLRRDAGSGGAAPADWKARPHPRPGCETIGLCLIDPEQKKLAAQIHASVERLLSLQRSSGHWLGSSSERRRAISFGHRELAWR